ncbi:Sec34-domain-containing protein [Dothidotthia symphoricarpi CBS 119687]|uniref:Conserved oligomeric Golgi complex subunit 3 n=1 Tax=Dothidotthia symphoricarpi CBS 119687 TaxID=1392245 RepID=A0A6A6AE28_9PLEO|nr:Sec34-domain-containing protein [Dothidotthia symphoricarpi CBS 119687]KAF2129826.1 Sec34-domain-containing protein [Dothidotthia symphoricarpi CBS 119687]
MYEGDSWFNAFVPRAPKPQERSRQARRESLLTQPNEIQADVARAAGIAETPEDAPDTLTGPPPATVARRAKSYSDFYSVVRAHLKKEKALERKKSQEHLASEIDFAAWYGGVNEDLLEASHAEYALYQNQLHMTRNQLDNIIADTTDTLDMLSSLSDSFKTVEAQTTAFRTQCEGLIDDQTRITKLADDMEQNLRYYLYLEPTTKRLNAPGAGKIVRGKEFTDMLANLDSCLEYMQANTKHREADTYRSRYRLLLTRALTLIRVHFTEALRDLAADVSKRIADRQLNDTTMSALLYAKFRVGAPELKSIGIEVQKRAVLPAGAAPGTEAEYQSLMNELYQSYSTTRGRLILPIVTKKIGEIAQAPSTSKDLVSFARSSISYIRGICFDECELWREWFDGDGGLYDFLEAMCEPLYDHLRPRTIHETQILKLCELCTLLQTRYMDEEDEEDSPIDANKLDFSVLVHPALEDAQSRLVFLSLAVLRDDIERYKPKPEDLDYPAKNKKQGASGKSNQPVLSGKKQPKADAPPTPLMPKTPTIVEDDDPDARWSFNTEAAFADWYPTLRKAIWLLSKIYRLVHSTVFDDLAHRIVHSTTLSLTHASTLLAKSSSPTDASLFLIAHLLVLKHQILAFDIEFVTPETDIHYDLSSISTSFWALQSRGAALFNPRNLVALLIPQVVENMLDAKAEVDARLRQAITQFTAAFCERITVPIAKGKKVPTAEAPARTSKIRQNVELEMPFLRSKLEEYVQERRTREMLRAAVMESVVLVYEEWFAGFGDGGVGRGMGKGKGREDGVWEPGVFAEWCAGVFRVGGGRGGEDEDSEDGDSGSERDTSSRSGTQSTRTGLRIEM